jgi:hypothetical protein
MHLFYDVKIAEYYRKSKRMQVDVSPVFCDNRSFNIICHPVDVLHLRPMSPWHFMMDFFLV